MHTLSQEKLWRKAIFWKLLALNEYIKSPTKRAGADAVWHDGRRLYSELRDKEYFEDMFDIAGLCPVAPWRYISQIYDPSFEMGKPFLTLAMIRRMSETGYIDDRAPAKKAA